MTIASVIVSRAFRRDNLIPVGTNPSTAEAAEGLAMLNTIIDTLFGNEIGEPLMEWPVPPPQRTAPVAAQYPLLPPASDLLSTQYPYPPCNVRLMASNTVATTVYLQNLPNDGARVAFVNLGITANLTLDGNGRKIDSSTTVVLTSISTNKTWFYRTDTGAWTSLATLTDSDEMPLPSEFDDYFVCQLAMTLPGAKPREGTVETRNSTLTKLKARYRQPTNAVGGGADMAPSWQTYGGGAGYDWMQ